jgi:transposase-like protein
MRTNEKTKREKKFRAAIRYWPVAFRWKLIQEIAAGLIDEQRACDKYGITVILIRKWRKQYYERKIQPLLTTQPMNQRQSQTKKINALEKQLKHTQKVLQDEKVKSRAYEIMIEVAEQKFNIPVRKKHGPGQSAK